MMSRICRSRRLKSRWSFVFIQSLRRTRQGKGATKLAPGEKFSKRTPKPPSGPGYTILVMLKEFREFAARGNVIDLAVGVIIGAAFGKVVSSLVTDVVMPPIGMVIGRVDFKN